MNDANHDGAAVLPQENGEERALEVEETTTTEETPEASAEETTTTEEAPAATETAAPAADPIDAMDEAKLDAILFARDASLINKNLTEDEKRAELKKFRAIDTRNKGKETPAKPSKDTPITHGDMEKANQKNAIREITIVAPTDDEDAKALKKEVDENWDEIRTFYTNRRGKATVADIVEDIKDAHTLWKARKGGAQAPAETGAEHLGNHSGYRGGTKPVATPGASPIADRFKGKGGPASWYPKKEGQA